MNSNAIPPNLAMRVCLKCNKEFLSESAGNRICKKCRRINAGLGPISEAQMAAQRGAKRLNGIPLEEPTSYESKLL
jgi:hypothetical protein